MFKFLEKNVKPERLCTLNILKKTVLQQSVLFRFPWRFMKFDDCSCWSRVIMEILRPPRVELLFNRNTEKINFNARYTTIRDIRVWIEINTIKWYRFIWLRWISYPFCENVLKVTENEIFACTFSFMYTFSMSFSVTSKRISDTTTRFQKCSLEVQIVKVFFRHCHVLFKIAELNFRLWKWRLRSAIEFEKYPSKI